MWFEFLSFSPLPREFFRVFPSFPPSVKTNHFYLLCSAFVQSTLLCKGSAYSAARLCVSVCKADFVWVGHRYRTVTARHSYRTWPAEFWWTNGALEFGYSTITVTVQYRPFHTHTKSALKCVCNIALPSCVFRNSAPVLAWRRISTQHLPIFLAHLVGYRNLLV